MKISLEQMLSQVDKLSDEIALDVNKAAVYLGVGKSTLDHRRLDGLPPPFIKYGTGRTAKVVYQLGELRKYRKAHTYTSTRQVQLSRVVLGKLHPFWKRGSLLLGSVVDVPALNLFLDPTTDVKWSSWRSALGSAWLQEEQRCSYLQKVKGNVVAIQNAHEKALKRSPVGLWTSSEFYTPERRWALTMGDMPFQDEVY